MASVGFDSATIAGMELDPNAATWSALIDAARVARANAYAPYSRFAVGAALACGDGTIVAGCNVENASFGGTICAERNAVWHAVATARRSFIACVVLTEGPVAAAPCGMCRQVLAEFADDLPILLVAETGGARRLVTLSAILPEAFRPRDLPK